MDRSSIGERLRSLREKKRKTAAEVAEACGISQSALTMYENGERLPRDEVKIRLAKYYGRTVQTIFFAQ
ncbi:helix-turn-helix transcriptional regulator [Selenomonas montiformis]|uniref:helix-turn-helix transcriptional regulator n=1 Tax=Selenomonas montiformis TaxID=2652285 RepID=UPI003F8CD1F4